MASVIQMLKRVKELNTSLKQIKEPSQENMLAFTGGRLMEELDQVTPDVKPMHFWQTLRQLYPVFAETTQQGHPKQ